MHNHTPDNSTRGTATLEFALTASFFFAMILVVVIGGHLFWMHNALVEATRRSARYAAMQCSPAVTTCTGYSTTVDRVKNMVLYGSPTAGTTPIVPGLQVSNVVVHFSTSSDCASCTDFGVGTGTVSVKIQNYNYNFVIPGINQVIKLPPYQTTVMGESAGFVAGTCP